MEGFFLPLVPLFLAHKVGRPLTSGMEEVTMVLITDNLVEGLLLSRMSWSSYLL